MPTRRKAFELNGTSISPGQRATVDLSVARLYTHASLTMPVHIIHGRRPGPTLFVSAAIHGDEINGVEIIRRLLKSPVLNRLRGTLVAVPIVNVYGFLQNTRYLPDRRDLNRNFPGSETGSLTARLAHMFVEDIVKNCTHGIDLHTGAVHRSNLPQIRVNLSDPESARLAHAFGLPLILNAAVRDGSLRQVAGELGIPVVVYEAGEALRFDEMSIRAGVKGVLGVMRALEMLAPGSPRRRRVVDPTIARSSSWVRASDSGILRVTQPLGARVCEGDVLGVIADPFGEREVEVAAAGDGIIIGRVNFPLVHEGDALFHIARVPRLGRTAAQVEELQSELPQPDPDFFDEPPIV